ncbi:hypothetical protein ACIO3O_04110 [Streptomyces sp. NPDC087440]|uniref:hypothetical protein n=1 Tax=Streptomyces sp. NPDC087440 TaxID=3365790 RepID=UPI00380909B7
MSWKPLYIGAVEGGPTPHPGKLTAGLQEIGRLVDAQPWEHSEDETAIDLVFHIPGSLLKPEYEGIRTGSLWRKRCIMQVQVAVPEELGAEEHDAIVRWYARKLVDAVELARTTLPRRKDALPVVQAATISSLATAGLV